MTRESKGRAGARGASMTDSPELIRVRGRVQGVGFRPTVCRLATQLGLPGWVRNDAQGVSIGLGGDAPLRARFLRALLAQLPPLAHVSQLSREPLSTETIEGAGFQVLDSARESGQPPAAQVTPDAALCVACASEVSDPGTRRYRYPFTNCTQCGPRFSITLGLPWDRSRTTMARFELCVDCLTEYECQTDRRYHAEPIACPRCGPRVQLCRSDGLALAVGPLDAPAEVASLLMRGEIVAIKGLGGYHLLVDATQPSAVERLRSRKRRPHKPFALMARDLALVETYCSLTARERACLSEPSAPIVLLRARTAQPAIPLAEALYPLPALARPSYGFMLPMTPLHWLALQNMPRPVVCTSGNRSEEPQVIDDAEVFDRLSRIADFIVTHDRPIHNRVDDSVVRVVDGRRRVLRRGRGLAPSPLRLPPGFEAVAQREAVWAAGADLKAAVCMSRGDDLVLSQYLGDLDDAETYLQYQEQSRRLTALFEHRATRVALDNHPRSRSAELARELAAERGLCTREVAHHHAHFAACLGDNGVPWDGRRCLGLVVDGIGMGETPGALWGCEVLVGNYRSAVRYGTLTETALLGGDRAAREPWRNLYAQLRAAFSWSALEQRYGALPCVQQLRAKPRALLDQLLERDLAAPRASSGGRLFDAVAAALGVCFEAQSYEAQAAAALEALIEERALATAVCERAGSGGYRLPVQQRAGQALRQLDVRPLWPALLDDLLRHEPAPTVAARFHVGFAAGLARLCAEVLRDARAASAPDEIEPVVALSGGCMQNVVLQQRVQAELEALGFEVLTHREVPPNDGGISFGQALVVLAQLA